MTSAYSVYCRQVAEEQNEEVNTQKDTSGKNGKNQQSRVAVFMYFHSPLCRPDCQTHFVDTVKSKQKLCTRAGRKVNATGK